jgi:hypothetical protein
MTWREWLEAVLIVQLIGTGLAPILYPHLLRLEGVCNLWDEGEGLEP